MCCWQGPRQAARTPSTSAQKARLLGAAEAQLEAQRPSSSEATLQTGTRTAAPLASAALRRSHRWSTTGAALQVELPRLTSAQQPAASQWRHYGHARHLVVWIPSTSVSVALRPLLLPAGAQSAAKPRWFWGPMAPSGPQIAVPMVSATPRLWHLRQLLRSRALLLAARPPSRLAGRRRSLSCRPAGHLLAALTRSTLLATTAMWRRLSEGVPQVASRRFCSAVILPHGAGGAASGRPTAAPLARASKQALPARRRLPSDKRREAMRALTLARAPRIAAKGSPRTLSQVAAIRMPAMSSRTGHQRSCTRLLAGPARSSWALTTTPSQSGPPPTALPAIGTPTRATSSLSAPPRDSTRRPAALAPSCWGIAASTSLRRCRPASLPRAQTKTPAT
mmetsp:Transcript_13586/g.29905  ORF Transcript_13586/g.29905 Transcript_13586/m.29905 type:complete len:393 (+) Transcript_13586:1070-2248(+)